MLGMPLQRVERRDAVAARDATRRDLHRIAQIRSVTVPSSCYLENHIMTSAHRLPLAISARLRNLADRSIAGRWPILDFWGEPGATLTCVKVQGVPYDVRDPRAVAYLALELAGGIRIDGVALRVNSRGELLVKFPPRERRRGGRGTAALPIDDHARGAIERAVLEALELQRPPALR